jgi:large subunit ribosomal protein L24
MVRQTISGGRHREAPKPTKMHVRRGDRVRVIRGNDAGKEGTVMQVMPKQNRVVVEGVNERKKHARPTQTNPDGGIIKFFAPVHASNVMLLDPTTGDPTRVRRELDASGKRQRIAVRSGKPIPAAAR